MNCVFTGITSLIIIKVIKYLTAYLNYAVSSNIPVIDAVSSILVLLTFPVSTEASIYQLAFRNIYMFNTKEEGHTHIAITEDELLREEGEQ